MISTHAGAAQRLTLATPGETLVAGKRLYFLDNLRVGLVMLVIAHHVGQAYGPTGGYWPIMETARSALLGPFFTVNRSFFMSLFFMISGYFTVMTFEASGAQSFVKSRLRRLGLPLLGWALLVSIPFQIFAAKSPAWPIDVGHLWFIEHLLLFSLGYALWRVLIKGRAGIDRIPLNPPGPLPILALALVIAVVSGVVRNWYPIDKWVILFGFVKVMWADVPRSGLLHRRPAGLPQRVARRSFQPARACPGWGWAWPWLPSGTPMTWGSRGTSCRAPASLRT